MKAEELELIARNTFVLDCPKITLSPQLSGSDKKTFEGAGSITQIDEGQFLLKLYCEGEISPKEALSRFFNTTVGKVIDDSEYYNLAAVDMKGRCWEAKRVLPNISSGPSPGYLVNSRLYEISHSESLHKTLEKTTVIIKFRGDIDIPCNEGTIIETFISGEKRSKSTRLNIARFQAAGFKFEIEKEKNWLTVKAVSDSLPINDAIITRFTEALQFVLGRTLNWSVLELFQERIQEIKVRASQENEEKSSLIRPPISFRSHDTADSVWTLFEKYLDHVISYPEKSWHPLFGLIHSVIESGNASLEAQALTLSVSTEGLLKREFSALATPDESFEEQVDDARHLIERSDLNETIKERLKGFLGSILSPRAKDRLFVLKEKGLIDDDFVEAWNRLRNSSAHADSPKSIDLQAYLNLCNSVLVLFYHLVFLAIGYTGDYTDYSSYHYPIRRFDKIIA